MSDIEDSSHSIEPPLVFRSTPDTLQSMAALELALVCWRFEMSNLYPDEKDSLSKDWFAFHNFHTFTSGDIFHIPNRIAELIDDKITALGIEIKNWTGCLGDICQYEDNEFKTEAVSNVLKNIVIEPCGNIIDVKTARKLITCDSFDLLDRLQIACNFSLESEIERLWPLVSNMPNNCELNRIKFYYWLCRMRNKLHEIPGNEQESAEFRFFRKFVLQTQLCYSWTDVEYFWPKLKPDEQTSGVTMACFFLEGVIPNALSKLNHAQLEDILTLVPNIVMEHLSYDYAHEYALETWNYMKDFVSHNEFYRLLYNLWQKAYCSSNRGCADVLLYEIWLEADPDLKNYVLENQVEEFFDDLATETPDSMENYGCDLRFLRCLLTDTKFELRNELWSRNWQNILKFAIPDDFDKFLRLCFGDEIDIVEFKNNALLNFEQSRMHFEIFIIAGRFRELMDYLKYFCSDENRMMRLKMMIIECTPTYGFKGSYSAIEFVTNFIDDKEDYIRCRLNSDEFDAFFLMSDTDDCFYLKNVIDFCLSSNQEYLAEVKHSLMYDHCLPRLCSGHLKIISLRDWDKFLKWCASSQQEFRAALLVDNIFEILLIDVIRATKRSESNLHEHLNSTADQIKYKYRCLINFLRWYFEHDAIKLNKLSKINSYCDLGVIRKKILEENESMITDVVNWFFDDDIEKIAKFCSRVVAV